MLWLFYGHDLTTMPPRVISIIIPVRNQARTLKALLDRLVALAPPPGWGVEIIPVYTDSRDDTLEVLRASSLPYRICTEVGPGAARNVGARHAQGALLLFIDADACPVGEDFLLRLVSSAHRLGRFGAFGGPILPAPGQRNNPIALADHWACWFNWSAQRKLQRSALFQPTVCVVIPRAVFEALGGFDPAIRVLEDHELQQRMMRRGLPIYFLPGFQVTHESRGSLLRSWRHSWYWGGPFRSTYLAVTPNYGLWFPVGHRLFWLNQPKLFWRRMRLVTRRAWRDLRWGMVWMFPFLALTILVWTLGVVWGEDQPHVTKAAPV